MSANFELRGAVVYGTVFDRLTGNPVRGVDVRAFDKDLRSEQLLLPPDSSVYTDENGDYRIEYTASQFRRAEKKAADLIVRAYSSDGTIRAESGLLLNAPREVRIDLILNGSSDYNSEYERLVASLSPLLEGVPASELTDEDLAFLQRESDESVVRLRILRRAAVLESETGIPTAAYYGLGRLDFSLDLKELTAQPLDQLRSALLTAIRLEIIPVLLRDSIEAILERLIRLRVEVGIVIERRVVGRLFVDRDNRAAAYITVHATDIDATPDPIVLTASRADDRGVFSLTYQTARPADGIFPPRQLRVRVVTSEGRSLAIAADAGSDYREDLDVTFPSDESAVTVLRVRMPEVAGDPTGPSPSVGDALGATGVALPPALDAFLSGKGIRTLDDVLRSGGLGRLVNLPVPADHPAVRSLEAHADLQRISPDLAVNQQLIENGFSRVGIIAETPRPDFVRKARLALNGDLIAATLHASSVAQTGLIDNLVAEFAARQATGSRNSLGPEDIFPAACCCPDCLTAMGPLAYLADLIQFARTHIRIHSNPWSLDDICTYLGQPFHRLTATCDAVDSPVRQVRIAVEVLRKLLDQTTVTPTLQGQIEAAERQHCQDVYAALLLRVGTNPVEVRLARGQGIDTARRDALAERLGIKANRLNEFLLDPASGTLTETKLEELFGFIDTNITRRDPLEPGATPKLLTWRIERLTELWAMLDRPDDRPPRWYEDPDDPALGARPLIDPDLLGLADFRHPVPGDAAFDLFMTRKNETDADHVVQRSALASDFSSGLAAAYPLPLPDLTVLRTNLQAPATALAALQTVRRELMLTPEAFLRLVELRDRANLGPLSAIELDEAAAIVTQARKATKFPTWIAAENSVKGLWGAEYFWIALQDPPLQTWRGSDEARSGWQQALRVRMRPPLIDPDLLILGGDGADNFELLDAAHGYGLFLDRRQALDGRATQLDAHRQTVGATDKTKFAAMILDGLETAVVDLNALEGQRRNGQSIAGRLDQLGLNAAGFNRLLRFADLADVGQTLLDSEWQETIAILVQAWKLRRFGQWRDEEAERKVVLGPDEFRIVTPPDKRRCGKSAIPNGTNRLPWPPPVPSVNRTPFQLWRAPEEAYRAWQDRLQSRIDQRETLAQALRDGVSAAEGAILPRFRDALLALVTTPALPSTETKANFLTRNLMTDFADSGCSVTTRVAHAFASIQALLTTLRMGESLPLLAGAVLVDLPVFDLAWRWIGGYATWRAAMFVFLYPENIAIPSLRPAGHQTPGFQDVVRGSGGTRRLNPDTACVLARDYAEYLRDVRTLRLEAGCQVTVPIKSSAGCGAVPQGERCVMFLFARSGVKDKKAYWMVYDPGRPDPDSQFPWAMVEPYGGQEVTGIIGAVPFQNDSGRRQVYLFAKFFQSGKSGLGFWTLDVDNWAAAPGTSGGWGNWKELEAPTDGDFEVTVVQTHGQNLPPHLVFAARHKVFDRSLNFRGDAWSAGTFREVPVHDIDTFSFNNIRGLHAAGDGGLGYFLMFEAWALPSRRVVEEQVTQTKMDCHWENDNGREDGEPYRKPRRVCQPVESQNTVARTVQDPGWNTIVCVWSGFSSVISKPFVFPKEWNQQRTCGIHYFAWERILYAWTAPRSGVLGFPIDQPTYAVTGGRDGLRVTRVEMRHGLPDHYVPVSTSSTAKDRNAERLGWTNYFGPAFHGVGLAGGTEKQPDAPTFVSVLKANPKFQAPTDVAHVLDGPTLQARKTLIAQAYVDNAEPASVARYLDEAFYYVPVQLGLGLQQSGHYIEALEWFRTVYDYTAPKADRRIHPLLINEASRTDTFKRGSAWLQDPLNPHAALNLRKDGNTRFVAFCIVRCLLDYADSEFTRDTSESVPLARQLYLQALDLLDDEDILGPDPDCEGIIDGLVFRNDTVARTLEARRFKAALRDAPNAEAARELVVAYSSDGHRTDGTEARAVVKPLVFSEMLAGERDRQLARRTWVVSDPLLDYSARRVGAQAGEAFQLALTTVTGMPAARLARVDLPWLHGEPAPRDFVRSDVAKMDILNPTSMARYAEVALKDPALFISKLGLTPGDYLVKVPSMFCVPPNSTAKTLRLRAEVNLAKIRTCRNIAGLQRSLDPYTAPTDATGGLPTIGPGGQLILPGVSQPRPTPYRFPVLIARAKELVQLAGQFESAMLDALRSKENENYTLLQARQDLRLARAGVRLQDLKVTEATNGVRMAHLQQNRAQIQVDQFASLIAEGQSDSEIKYLEYLQDSAYSQWAAVAAYASAALTATGAALAPSEQKASFAIEAFNAAGSVASTTAGVFSTWASIFSTRATYERRAQEWAMQKSLAEQDVAIGAQQVILAESQVDVTNQERTIANLQVDNAETIVNFLTNKFLTAELYAWMAGMLEDVYRYFLQEAAAVAQTAADQLSFERQETPPPFIKSDYWATPQDSLGVRDAAQDRKGLTGSARLTQDIYQLDQYTFITAKRKLQLVRAISLAWLDPLAFAQFRETGLLRFRTRMNLFDRDFPGHFLRLISRVRVSVVALVPVSEGIRATLSAVGPSRTVIGGFDGFQTVALRRPPESATYTSPINSTGLFDLDSQPEMLAPFEGMGVDAGWEFQLPKASNPFDFATIADVILTFEYTALSSADYRKQVITSLEQDTAFDIAFSFRNQFADAWYDLHNPDMTSTPLTVAVSTVEGDFPPHFANLRLEQIALLVVVDDRPHPFDDESVGLRFAERGAIPEVGGDARSIDGLVTTRGATGTPWLAITGREPVGIWKLAFSNTAPVRDLFARNAVKDIVLVLTCRARLPEFPQ